jgi:hypothetical protein
MSITVFFSWQSDRSSNEGRNFIETALQRAIANISQNVELDEPNRHGIELDKDTAGVPGSPPIFETILEKIDRAAVFVPDLTFVSERPNEHPSPNPNGLIEYGYALKSLSSHRIIGIGNNAILLLPVNSGAHTLGREPFHQPKRFDSQSESS